jgi:hypothetical protein
MLLIDVFKSALPMEILTLRWLSMSTADFCKKEKDPLIVYHALQLAWRIASRPWHAVFPFFLTSVS